MKKVRILMREVSMVTYEVEAEDDFKAFKDVDEVMELLYGPQGYSPDPIETEVAEEIVEDAWEV